MAYSAEASWAISLGRLTGPITLTPPSTTVSPALVSSQLPPVSAAMSTITEPGCIPRTASAVISSGAWRPGIAAVLMITSLRLAASASSPRSFTFSSSVSGRA